MQLGNYQQKSAQIAICKVCRLTPLGGGALFKVLKRIRDPLIPATVRRIEKRAVKLKHKTTINFDQCLSNQIYTKAAGFKAFPSPSGVLKVFVQRRILTRQIPLFV